MENETLIGPLEEKVNERAELPGEKNAIRCGFCDKKIPRGQKFISPGGYPYCNPHCFALYTED